MSYTSTINLGEVLYRLHRIQGADTADGFWEDVRRGTLPLTLVEATRTRVREAARIKGTYPIAYAGAFAAQMAREKQVPLVIGDPEFRSLEADGALFIRWLPCPSQASQ